MKKTSTPPTQQGPKRQSAESTSVDLDASIQRLIVVSDLHAYREPLEAVDCYLGELTDDYRVFVNGDFFDGGMHATGRTPRQSRPRRVRLPAGRGLFSSTTRTISGRY